MGYPLYRVVQVSRSPRAATAAAPLTPDGPRRHVRRRAPLGARVDDGVPIAHGFVGDDDLDDAVEDEPAAAGGAAVGAEHELVEVGLQVRLVDRSLVGAEPAALGE